MGNGVYFKGLYTRGSVETFLHCLLFKEIKWNTFFSGFRFPLKLKIMIYILYISTHTQHFTLFPLIPFILLPLYFVSLFPFITLLIFHPSTPLFLAFLLIILFYESSNPCFSNPVLLFLYFNLSYF